MTHTAAFIMPLKIKGNELELRFLRESIDSIKNQTDKDWVLIIVEDFSDDKKVYEFLDNLKVELKDKIHILYSDKNYGTGSARNKGVQYASKLGIPFILYLDADDLADKRRLELVRKAFEDESTNVVYTSFDVIDENDHFTPLNEVSLPVREIIEGHKKDVVEGENSWIKIAMKKKYTNLTSCTAVRTSLAVEELFPPYSISEDCHTWFRYGAHPGKFIFLKEIKGGYRICRGVASRSRALNPDFYEKLFQTDIDGFESAVKLAKKYNTMGDKDENEIRTAFHVRLALNLLHGNSPIYANISLEMALNISKENTFYYIDNLDCPIEEKKCLKEMIL